MSEHVGDLLSAYADGQIEPDEKATVEDHLLSCPQCQEELQDIREAQDLLSPMPLLVPPTGFFFSGFSSLNRSRRWIVLSIVALAAAAIVAFIVYPAQSDFEIRGDDLAEQHSKWSPTADVPPSDAPSPFGAPIVVSGFERQGNWRVVAFGNANALHMQYSNGLHQFSLFEHEGSYPDFDDRTVGSTEVGVYSVKYASQKDANEVSWRSGPLVMTLVSNDVPRDDLLEMAAQLKKGSQPSAVQQARHALRQILQTLAGD